MNKIEYFGVFIIYVIFVILILQFKSESNEMTLMVETSNLQEWLDSQMSWESRNYVVSGKDDFKSKYSSYTSSSPAKWSDLSYLDAFKKFDNYSLEKIYSTFSIYDDDLKYLYDAQNIRKDLMWIETVSINMYDGYIDENDEAKSKFESNPVKKFIQFTVKSPTDMKKEAVNMLFSPEYVNKKNMFTALVKKGSEIILKRQQSHVNTYGYLIMFSLLIILVINLVYWRKKLQTT
jgi:hypothetical protein